MNPPPFPMQRGRNVRKQRTTGIGPLASAICRSLVTASRCSRSTRSRSLTLDNSAVTRSPSPACCASFKQIAAQRRKNGLTVDSEGGFEDGAKAGSDGRAAAVAGTGSIESLLDQPAAETRSEQPATTPVKTVVPSALQSFKPAMAKVAAGIYNGDRQADGLE